MNKISNKINIDMVEAEYRRLKQQNRTKQETYRFRTINTLRMMLSRDQYDMYSVPYEVVIIASLMDLRNKRRLEVIEEFANRLWIFNMKRFSIEWVIKTNSMGYLVRDNKSGKVLRKSEEFNANGMERQTRAWFDRVIVGIIKDVAAEAGEDISTDEARYIYNIVQKQVKEVCKKS